MQYIILFLCIFTINAYNNQPSYSSKPYSSQEKKCINCQFFLLKQNNPFNHNLETNPEFGKCSLFPKPERKNNLIVGDDYEDINNMEFSYCTTARSFKDMCGKNGRFYRPKKYAKKKQYCNKIRKLFKYYLGDEEKYE